jgi:putative intracellular protease/amidase/GNAT superfamily N-acetyltransferase
VSPARIAFLVFPGLTLLDLVGPYDALRRVRTMGVDPSLAWTFVATAPAPTDDCGLPVHADVVRGDLSGFDLLVVPGGLGADALAGDEEFLQWLRGWGEARPIASVCSGSLLLGAAGLLRGLPATTHHTRREQLRPLCGEVVERRVVDAGRVVTSGGVTAGIELGLHLVEKFWGAAVRRRIATQIEHVEAARGPVVLRTATLADVEALSALIPASVRGLSRGDYDDEQIEAALGTAFGVDSQLIRDGTYFVAEVDGEIVGCGGWSRRRTLFGGDRQPGREPTLLDPAHEPAKIRAFFVHPEHARRGIGRALLARCEDEAQKAGFSTAEMMATLPGVRLYRALGYSPIERVAHPLRPGLSIEFMAMRKALAPG